MPHRAAVLGAVAALLAATLAPAGASADEAVARDRAVAGGFTRVKVSGPFQATVREGATPSVVVTATVAEQERVKVEVRGDTLVVAWSDRGSGWGSGPGRDIQVAVVLPELRALELAGSGSARAETGAAPRDLSLRVSGSGSVEWKGAAAALALAVSGSGDLVAVGPSASLSAALSGSGDVRYEGKTGAARVTIAGSGDARLVGSATELDASIAGSGDVDATGFTVRDGRVRSSTAGSGRVRTRG